MGSEGRGLRVMRPLPVGEERRRGGACAALGLVMDGSVAVGALGTVGGRAGCPLPGAPLSWESSGAGWLGAAFIKVKSEGQPRQEGGWMWRQGCRRIRTACKSHLKGRVLREEGRRGRVPFVPFEAGRASGYRCATQPGSLMLAPSHSFIAVSVIVAKVA